MLYEGRVANENAQVCGKTLIGGGGGEVEVELPRRVFVVGRLVGLFATHHLGLTSNC